MKFLYFNEIPRKGLFNAITGVAALLGIAIAFAPHTDPLNFAGWQVWIAVFVFSLIGMAIGTVFFLSIGMSCFNKLFILSFLHFGFILNLFAISIVVIINLLRGEFIMALSFLAQGVGGGIGFLMGFRYMSQNNPDLAVFADAPKQQKAVTQLEYLNKLQEEEFARARRQNNSKK